MYLFHMYLGILCFFTIFLSIKCSETKYNYLSYDQIIDQFYLLEQKYPNLIKIRELREESQIKDLPETKCGQNVCKHIYAEITNFNKENYKQNPQAFIIGGFHGDEAIGPNVVTYLAEYILNNYESSLYFKDLIENKMVVLLPMANPSGYFQLKREEIQMDGTKIDINRDFPYNNVASKCFKSAGARVINYLFKKYLFQVGITFHGGMYAIGYPWGSVNHQKKPNVGELSPDNKAFSIIGNYMKQMSPGNKKLQISEYPVDTLTNGIYAVPGTLEDWAYAAQWEPEKTGNQYLLAKCDNISQQELQLPQNSVKSLFYLIETSGPKKPQASTLGTYEAVSNKNSENFGHIPRNINAALAIIETLKPTIYMDIKEVDDNKYVVSWQVYGCSKVDKTQLYYQIGQKNELYNQELKYIQENFISSENVFSGDGYIKNQTHYFQDYIQKSNLVEKNQELKVAIYVQCDSQFGEQENSVPDLPPQSHLVQSRTNSSYHIKNNNDYEILQTKEIFQTNFQNQYAESIKYKNFQKFKFQKADNKINEKQNNEQNKNDQINQVETEFLYQNNLKNDYISRNLQLGQVNQNDGENQQDGEQQQNKQIQDGEIKQQDGENNPSANNQQYQDDGENNQQLKDNQSQQNDGEDTNKNQNNNENQQDQDGETEEEGKNDNLGKNSENENDEDQDQDNDNNEQDQDQDEQKQEDDAKNNGNNNNSSKNKGDNNKKNNINQNGDKNGDTNILNDQSLIISVFVVCIVIVVIVLVYYIIKRILKKLDPQHQFYQMDKKLTGEDKIKRQLQIDMGVSQTDHSIGDEEIQFGEDDANQKKTLQNQSNSRIKHVIE